MDGGAYLHAVSLLVLLHLQSFVPRSRAPLGLVKCVVAEL